MIKPVSIPGGRVPPAPKIPKPSVPHVPGGRVQPTIQRQPAQPKQSMQQAATQNAMNAFHTALAQLQGAIPQVDQNAVYAPYRASEAVAGQLGTGLQNSLQQAGQAASQQYTTGLDAAQQHAAQFGISAGAGADATQLQNNGTQQLATQTNAYSASAPAAAAAWQALLERTGANAVSNANLNRSNTIASGTASLAGAIPGEIQTEKDFAFKQGAQKFNENLAKTQLSQKQNAALRSYELGAAKVNTSASTAATNAEIKREALAEKTATDKAKLNQGQQKINQGQVKLTAAQTKAAKGLAGVPAAVKALTPSTSKGGTTRAAKGFDVTIQPWDTANNKPNGPVKTIHAARNDFAPPGYKNVGATTHYESVPASSVTTGVTKAQWDAQYRSLLGQNEAVPNAAAKIRAVLGPRPK